MDENENNDNDRDMNILDDEEEEPDIDAEEGNDTGENKESKKNNAANEPRYKWSLIEDEAHYDNYLKLDDDNWPLPPRPQIVWGI